MLEHVHKRISKLYQQLCQQKKVGLIESHVMPDHVHMLLGIPPKFSVAMLVGYLKEKLATQIHRKALNVKRGFTGKKFWSSGYCVSTARFDEQMVHTYFRGQIESNRQENLFNQQPLLGACLKPPLCRWLLTQT
jgi:putative transposase